jgi:hypothetical protein
MKENTYTKILEANDRSRLTSGMFCLFMLQLAKNVGNNSFNDIMEANLPSPSPKPTPSSDM